MVHQPLISSILLRWRHLWWAFSFKIYSHNQNQQVFIIYDWTLLSKAIKIHSHNQNCQAYISYSTVVLYSRDRYEIIGLRKISHFIEQPCSSVCLKTALAMHQSCSNNAVQCSTLAKQSGKSNISIYSKLLKFQASPKFRLPDRRSACCKTQFR